MATPREYFDADFDHTVRVQFKLPIDKDVTGAALLDFASLTISFACYVPGQRRSLDFFRQLMRQLIPNKQVELDTRIQLPAARYMPGEMRFQNNAAVGIEARYFGDPEWALLRDFQGCKRVFIYSETQLRDDEIVELKAEGRSLGRDFQFRSVVHAAARSRNERPLAFISHDSRDKEVARKIAIGLQKLMCPVWYDEFSLQVGDSLRDSIEQGLKVCQKCVLLLSANFVSNSGWTKKEFDSIFTRELLNGESLLLPVWLSTTREQVFDYSPALLNVKGVDWNTLGEDEVCRQLYNAVLGARRVNWSATPV